jgi:hypothetical protein
MRKQIRFVSVSGTALKRDDGIELHFVTDPAKNSDRPHRKVYLAGDLHHLAEISPDALGGLKSSLDLLAFQSLATGQPTEFAMWLHQEAINCPRAAQPLSYALGC